MKNLINIIIGVILGILIVHLPELWINNYSNHPEIKWTILGFMEAGILYGYLGSYLARMR